MRSKPTLRTRRAAGLLAGGLLLAPLTACADATTDQRGSGETPPTSALTEALPTDAPVADGVTCENDTCSVTLDAGAEAEVLGTTLAFTSSQDGTATLRVGDSDATCAEGETVTAGPLRLECTEVTEDSVTLTAALE